MPILPTDPWALMLVVLAIFGWRGHQIINAISRLIQVWRKH